MGTWDNYPSTYREAEVKTILRSVCAGECAAVIGLSGSGKSNLIGFLAHHLTPPTGCPRLVAVDCNRLVQQGPHGFYQLLLQALERDIGIRQQLTDYGYVLAALEAALTDALDQAGGICFLLDRFDALYSGDEFPVVANSLRALRDTYKYRLTLVIAARRLPPVDNELAELFFGHTIWLGALSPEDALWSARRDARRYSSAVPEPDRPDWGEASLRRLVELSGGYPSLLRAAIEAYAGGAAAEDAVLGAHPAVRRRVDEFWADRPDAAELREAGIDRLPWLMRWIPPASANAELSGMVEIQLTAKESRLLEFLKLHPGEVCAKDDLVRAVWPEDVVYTQGIRDESLAQLVRRLRVKVEIDPSEPRHIHTVPGRGYLFKP